MRCEDDEHETKRNAKCKPKDMMKFNPLQKSILSLFDFFVFYFQLPFVFFFISSLNLCFGRLLRHSFLHKIAKWAIRPDCIHSILLYLGCYWWVKTDEQKKSKSKRQHPNRIEMNCVRNFFRSLDSGSIGYGTSSWNYLWPNWILEANFNVQHSACRSFVTADSNTLVSIKCVRF